MAANTLPANAEQQARDAAYAAALSYQTKNPSWQSTGYDPVAASAAYANDPAYAAILQANQAAAPVMQATATPAGAASAAYDTYWERWTRANNDQKELGVAKSYDICETHPELCGTVPTPAAPAPLRAAISAPTPTTSVPQVQGRNPINTPCDYGLCGGMRVSAGGGPQIGFAASPNGTLMSTGYAYGGSLLGQLLNAKMYKDGIQNAAQADLYMEQANVNNARRTPQWMEAYSAAQGSPFLKSAAADAAVANAYGGQTASEFARYADMQNYARVNDDYQRQLATAVALGDAPAINEINALYPNTTNKFVFSEDNGNTSVGYTPAGTNVMVSGQPIPAANVPIALYGATGSAPTNVLATSVQAVAAAQMERDKLSNSAVQANNTNKINLASQQIRAAGEVLDAAQNAQKVDQAAIRAQMTADNNEVRQQIALAQLEQKAAQAEQKNVLEQQKIAAAELKAGGAASPYWIPDYKTPKQTVDPLAVGSSYITGKGAYSAEALDKILTNPNTSPASRATIAAVNDTLVKLNANDPEQYKPQNIPQTITRTSQAIGYLQSLQQRGSNDPTTMALVAKIPNLLDELSYIKKNAVAIANRQNANYGGGLPR